MYQIKWDEVMPQLLPKMIDRRVVRAYGSFFDCQFTLDFDDKSSVQFKCDDLTHRNAIEFEIILNRQKIYNPLHFDSSDVFTNSLGKIMNATEHRTAKRNNVREIIILFDAHKKHFSFSQLILSNTKYNQFALNQTITDEIASFLYPRNDKMTIRTYRKCFDLQRRQSAESVKIQKHEKLIKELYHDKQSNNIKNEEINYDDSVFNLYPIQTRNDNTNNDENTNVVDSLYPIGNTQNDEDGNQNAMNENIQNTKIQTLNRKKKEYQKIYCDVVCRVCSWMTYTTTAKKQKQ